MQEIIEFIRNRMRKKFHGVISIRFRGGLPVCIEEHQTHSPEQWKKNTCNVQ